MSFLPPNSLIVAGPVIVENGKVLLNKEKKPSGPSLWMFPGGKVEDFSLPLEESCRREAREELGIELADLRLFKIIISQCPEKKDDLAILVHFLAKRVSEVKPGPETIEWGWQDINNLPPDCAENVYTVIEELKSQKL
ncbi:MAG TPA: NUDIX domain-containing protein [Patescibacteria group bacterium]|nr:NUDIX domain-containing protein [Patescibacteria group bacterium]